MSKRKEFTKKGGETFLKTIWPKKGRTQQEALARMLEDDNQYESLRAYSEGLAHHTITPRNVIDFQRDYGAALAEQTRAEFDAEIAKFEAAGLVYGADYEPSDEEEEMAAFNEQQLAGNNQ